MASASISNVACRLISQQGRARLVRCATTSAPTQSAPRLMPHTWKAVAATSNSNQFFFSTAAVVQEEVAPPVEAEQQQQQQTPKKKKGKRRRTLQTKNPIIVTERAADRIKELLAGDNANGAIGIILGVKRRGCNGLSYTLNYAFEEPEEKNGASMTAHGIKVFIEPMALFNVVGTKMDWEEDELTSEFTFNNPNSKGECGCGESFNV